MREDYAPSSAHVAGLATLKTKTCAILMNTLETNHHFKQWTRSTAFQIQLSERMIAFLLDMFAVEVQMQSKGRCPPLPTTPYGREGVACLLERRGLLKMHERGGYILTRSGCLTAELLMTAGFEPTQNHLREWIKQHYDSSKVYP